MVKVIFFEISHSKAFKGKLIVQEFKTDQHDCNLV